MGGWCVAHVEEVEVSGSWYPSLHDQLDAEQQLIEQCACDDGEFDFEGALYDLAADGNVEALEALRAQLFPVD